MTDTLRPATDGDISSTLRREEAAYRQGEDRPLRSFVAIMAAYLGAVGVGAVAVRRKGLPERIPWSDLALVAATTHKLSRLVAKDPVTSPLRAPFTRFEGTTGPAELKEEVRGTGPRKAVGEMVTCPFCLGQWIATSLVFGLILAPKATRTVTSVFTALAAADFLHLARAAAEKHAES